MRYKWARDMGRACAAIRASDLEGVPLVVSKPVERYNQLSAWFRQTTQKPDIVATYKLIYNAALLVEENIDCALTLDKLVNTTGALPLRFRPLEPVVYLPPLYLIWEKHAIFPNRPNNL